MRKILHFTLALYFLFVLSYLSPQHVFAQTVDWGGCVDPATGIAKLECIPKVFQNVVTAALMLAGVVAVFMIIFAGIRYITSRGDPKAVEGAKNTLTWAIIGLVVILLAFFIINFISFFTGAECIKMFGFTNCQ